MATLVTGKTFTATEQVTATKLNNIVNLATISGIVAADITDGVITGVKLAAGEIDLTTKVTGTLPVANGGTGVVTSTGSGANALATSPTLVTPILGVPTSGTLTNCAGLPIDGGTINTLPVARGGTGLTALGSASQLLRTNAAANALEYFTPAATLFTVSFASTAQTITQNGSLTIAHSLGTKPILVFAYIKCTSADANYSVGDEVYVPIHLGATANSSGISLRRDSTNLLVRFPNSSSIFAITDLSTGALSAADIAKWQLYLLAYA
jgi:hypothetical protein